MKRITLYIPIFLFLLVILAFSFDASHGISTDQSHAGSIDAVIDKDDVSKDYVLGIIHQFRTDNSEGYQKYVARNTTNNIEIELGEDGFIISPAAKNPEWNWGLKYVGHGYGAKFKINEVEKFEVSGRKLELHRGEIIEWYLNDEKGFEQFFTVNKPSDNSQKESSLTIYLKNQGTLRPKLSVDKRTIKLADDNGDNVLDYSSLYAYDARGKELNAEFRLTQDVVLIEVDIRGAQYPIVVDPFVERTKLFPSNGIKGDNFGGEVAIDGNTIAIASQDSDIRRFVYIYDRDPEDPNEWNEVKILDFSNSMEGDCGFFLGAESRFRTISLKNDLLAIYGGCVYERNMGGTDNWGLVRRITSSDGRILVSPDIDGDTIVFGSDEESFYIFERNQGGTDNWGEVKKIEYEEAVGTQQAVISSVSVAAYDLTNNSIKIYQKDFGGVNNWGLVKNIPLDLANVGLIDIDQDTLIVPRCVRIGAMCNEIEVFIFKKDHGGSDNWGEIKSSFTTFPPLINIDLARTSGAISGDYILVNGTDIEGGDFENSPVAVVFGQNIGGINNWGELQKLHPDFIPGNGGEAYTGAINDETIVMGFPDANDPTPQTGHALVFENVDLSILKTSDKDSVSEGIASKVTYTISLENPSKFDVFDVQLMDPLPDGSELIASESSENCGLIVVDDPELNPIGTFIFCIVGDMGPSEITEFFFTLEYSNPQSEISNTATLNYFDGVEPIMKESNEVIIEVISTDPDNPGTGKGGCSIAASVSNQDHYLNLILSFSPVLVLFVILIRNLRSRRSTV